MHLCKQQMHVQACSHLILCIAKVKAWREKKEMFQHDVVGGIAHNSAKSLLDGITHIDSSFIYCQEIHSEILSLLAKECRSRILCNQQPTHSIHKHVMTSRTVCIIQSLCRVTSNRTWPDLNPSEETERPSLSFFQKLIWPFDPYQQK